MGHIRKKIRIFQSYQSGIEIQYREDCYGSNKHFQSYQSGIEMYVFIILECPQLPFNRTKVELKSRQRRGTRRGYQHFQSYQSGIEIHEALRSFYRVPTFNRTKVELKLPLVDYIRAGCHFQSYQSGIEIECYYKRRRKQSLSIVPKWN